jgi:L-aspartate oxidase
LLEGAVMGHRAVDDVLQKEPLPARHPREFTLDPWISGDAQDVDELVVIYHNWDEIRRLMWDYVSIVRTSKRLQRAATRLRTLQKEVQEFYWGYRVTAEVLELRNLVQVAALIVDSAHSRHESRGAHCTLDYPEIDDAHFKKNTQLWRV